jgi:hypothetical protein
MLQRSLSLSLSLTHTHTHTLSNNELSSLCKNVTTFPLSLSHTHTHTHTHPYNKLSSLRNNVVMQWYSSYSEDSLFHSKPKCRFTGVFMVFPGHSRDLCHKTDDDYLLPHVRNAFTSVLHLLIRRYVTLATVNATLSKARTNHFLMQRYKRMAYLQHALLAGLHISLFSVYIAGTSDTWLINRGETWNTIWQYFCVVFLRMLLVRKTT